MFCQLSVCRLQDSCFVHQKALIVMAHEECLPSIKQQSYDKTLELLGASCICYPANGTLLQLHGCAFVLTQIGNGVNMICICHGCSGNCSSLALRVAEDTPSRRSV